MAPPMDEKLETTEEMRIRKRGDFVSSLISKHPALDFDFVHSLFTVEDMVGLTPKRAWEKKAGKARQLCRALQELLS